MVEWLVPPAAPGSLYPDRDGKPMSDNTTQARWMTILFGNLSAWFRDMADVFVAMDLLWYAVEKEPEVRQAPDVFVVFGRPKGDRGSYQQWLEGGIAPQVVFEILSPGNTHQEMVAKFAFYEEHGVQEYYVFDPFSNWLEIYVRKGSVLRRVRRSSEWISPLLDIRFDLKAWPMAVFAPDGTPFLTFEAQKDLQRQTEQERDEAQQRAARIEQERDQAQQRVAH
jgi:Uma2 family endonuclease